MSTLFGDGGALEITEENVAAAAAAGGMMPPMMTPANKREQCARIQNAQWNPQRAECMCRHGWLGPWCKHAWCGGPRVGLWDDQIKRCVCAMGYDGATCDRCVTTLGRGIRLYCCHAHGSTDWALAMLSLESYEALAVHEGPERWECIENDARPEKLGCACEQPPGAAKQPPLHRALLNISEERQYWAQRERAWITEGSLRAQPLAWTSVGASVLGAAIADVAWQGQKPVSRTEIAEVIAQQQQQRVAKNEEEEEGDNDSLSGKTRILFIIMMVALGVCFILLLVVIGMAIYIRNNRRQAEARKLRHSMTSSSREEGRRSSSSSSSYHGPASQQQQQPWVATARGNVVRTTLSSSRR